MSAIKKFIFYMVKKKGITKHPEISTSCLMMGSSVFFNKNCEVGGLAIIQKRN